MRLEFSPLTLTVAHADANDQNADLIGSTHKVLQAAVNTVAAQGGGTVHIGPGVFRMRNAVHLASNVCLRGSGGATVLEKASTVSCPLRADTDWYLEHFEPEDASLFAVGDGVTLRAGNRFESGPDHVQVRTIVGRVGDRLMVDRKWEQNMWLENGATASRLHSLVHAMDQQHMAIRDLVLDGTRDRNDNLNGNYGAGIFMQSCRDVEVTDVTVRNYNGDGMSWQIVHDMRVTRCRSINNANLGLHPGSGSQRPIMTHNEIDGCSLGIFFCWGVKHGLAEHNRVRNIVTHGVSIGHRDTDNIVRHNDIARCDQNGIYLRPESTPCKNAHRNLLEANTIRECPIGINLLAPVDDTRIVRNDVADCDTALHIAQGVGNVYLDGNSLVGRAHDVVDDRKPT